MRRFSMRLSIITIVLLAAGCNGALLTRAKNQQQETAAAALQEIVIPVEVTQPRRRDMAAYIKPVGWISAERRVDVAAKGSGECLSVAVDEGDSVEEGQVLAELDPDELEAQIRQSEVTLNQNKYELDVAKREAAAGSFAEHQAQLKEFMVRAAQATLDLQRIQLRHQTIRAPIAGVVTARNIQKGMMVSPGSPVFTLVDPDSYMLPIEVPERELGRLAVGQEALVEIDSEGGVKLPAHVRRIHPSVDAQKGTVKVVLDFAPEDRPGLRDGAFVRVELVMEVHPQALVIPKEALIEEDARSYVMVARLETPEETQARREKAEEAAKEAEEKAEASSEPAKEDANEAAQQPQAIEPRLVAERTLVEKGLEDSDDVEILFGLSEDTQVIILGQHTLKDGAPVEITDAETELRNGDSSAESSDAPRS